MGEFVEGKLIVFIGLNATPFYVPFYAFDQLKHEGGYKVTHLNYLVYFFISLRKW